MLQFPISAYAIFISIIADMFLDGHLLKHELIRYKTFCPNSFAEFTYSVNALSSRGFVNPGSAAILYHFLIGVYLVAQDESEFAQVHSF